MKITRVFVLISVLCFSLIGCGNNDTGVANDNQKENLNEEETQFEPEIEGYVTNEEDGRMLVVSSRPKDFSSTGGLEEFYNAIWVSKVMNEVEIGQKVQVWFSGSILESYPGQGEADKVSIVPSIKPEGAQLTEAQAIKKALTKQGNDTTSVIVIKDVNYNKDSDTWSVFIKVVDGEQEINVRIEDK